MDKKCEGTDSPAIRCEDLTKRYPGGILAADKISLTVERGEIFGLLGPNGAGKTTTVGMLTTLVIPTGGQASVGEVNVVKHPALVKQMIGVVPQNNTLDRALTVWENLYYHARFFGLGASEAQAATEASLRKFHLIDRANADVMAISGGMAKRLMVARALIHKPRVLFLDEPTAGLDPQSRLALWDVLRGLLAECQSVLLTTHHMEEAETLCNRIAIIDHGRVLAVDSPQGLKRSVEADNIVTISAKGELDKLGQILKERIEGVTRSQPADGTLQVHVRGAAGMLPKIVTVAEQAGFVISDLALSEPTLETVFLNLTGKELRD